MLRSGLEAQGQGGDRVIWALVMIALVAILAGCAIAAVRLQGRDGRLKQEPADEFSSADRYAGVDSVGRTEQEIARSRDPAHVMEDFEAGPSPYPVPPLTQD